jgi:hypothetical protein
MRVPGNLKELIRMLQMADKAGNELGSFNYTMNSRPLGPVELDINFTMIPMYKPPEPVMPTPEQIEKQLQRIDSCPECGGGMTDHHRGCRVRNMEEAMNREIAKAASQGVVSQEVIDDLLRPPPDQPKQPPTPSPKIRRRSRSQASLDVFGQQEETT